MTKRLAYAAGIVAGVGTLGTFCLGKEALDAYFYVTQGIEPKTIVEMYAALPLFTKVLTAVGTVSLASLPSIGAYNLVNDIFKDLRTSSAETSTFERSVTQRRLV